jgi:hypothetical protein
MRPADTLYITADFHVLSRHTLHNGGFPGRFRKLTLQDICHVDHALIIKLKREGVLYNAGDCSNFNMQHFSGTKTMKNWPFPDAVLYLYGF